MPKIKAIECLLCGNETLQGTIMCIMQIMVYLKFVKS